LIHKLASEGVKLNITAMTTVAQVQRISDALGDYASSYVSVFAGRIADTGRDPLPIMKQSMEILRPHPTQELIWASPRGLFNVIQADQIGCHIITATTDVLKKLDLIGKDLTAYSLETVKMFYQDAKSAGFSL
jgi:transaldolase